MRTIERTGQFKRDYKREAKGQHRLVLDYLFDDNYLGRLTTTMLAG